MQTPPFDWERVSKVFSSALEAPPANRAARLRQLTEGDETLRATVEGLLAVEEEASRWLADVPDGLGKILSAIDDNTDPLQGRSIGDYRLLAPLGQGGMGSVYLAQRRLPPTQSVALKILHGGFGSDEIVRRFTQERDILASFNHDNIARVLDGGKVDERPYFSMEFVEGIPITKYCNVHHLPVRKRVELFLDVCDATSYAHQKFVVHRDLKPSNIFVTNAGRVKLLDFGIAKVLHKTETLAAAPTTRGEVRLVTPEYGSPEQLRGDHVSAASDVYSLAVVLYELLCGRRPYYFDTRDASLVADRLRNLTIPHCSEAVNLVGTETREPDADPKTVSLERGKIQPEELQRQLRGDLDSILRKGLEFDQSHRYPAVSELASDLRRYLNAEPVSARRQTTRYRAEKFLRRHRVGVLIAAVVLVFLSTIAGFTARLAAVRTQQTIQLAAERDKAEAVAEFLVDMFSEADPAQALGDTLDVYELLARGTERIDSALAEQPEIRATILHSLADVYKSLGAYEEASQLADSAWSVRSGLFGEHHQETAQSLMLFASLLERTGNLDSAIALSRRTLVIRRELLEPDHEEIGEVLNNLGLYLYENGAWEEAEERWRDALSIRRRIGDDDQLATTLGNLAVLVGRMGHAEEAEPMYLEAAELVKKVHGERHPDYANRIFNLGAFYVDNERYDEAEQLYGKALEIRRSIYDSQHPDIASSINNLAYLNHRKGEVDKADSLYREALALYTSVFGEHHKLVAIAMTNIGSLSKARGDTRAAEQLYEQAVEIFRQTSGDANLEYGTALWNLALAVRDRDDLDSAAILFEELIQLRRSVYRGPHPNLELAVRTYAQLKQRQGNLEKADSLFSESVQMSRDLWPADPPLARALVLLGIVRIEQKNSEAALPTLREALAIRQDAYGSDSWLTANVRSNIGEALLQLGRYEQAESLLVDSYHVLRDDRGENHARTLDALRRLVNLYNAWDKPEEADRYNRLIR